MSDSCSSCGCDAGNSAASPADRAIEPGAKALSLRISKMDCPSEEALIRRAFAGVSGVDDLRFDLLGRTLTIVHRLPDPALILATLESVGMPAEPVPAQGTRGGSPAEPEVEERRALTRENVSLAIAGGAALGSELLAYATGDKLSWPVGLLALVAISIGGLPTLRKGWMALKTLTLNIDLLMSVAVLGAFAIGQWPEAAVVIWLFEIAERIESASLDRARNAIKALMALAPEKALVRQSDGAWAEVDASEVTLDAVMRVRPGERIALDGVVVGGESAVDQAPITGESMPARKGPGDPVFAGTINERGVLEVRVTAAKGATTLDRIARAVQAAHEKRAPTQRFVDRFARVYTPVVFVIALAVAIVPPLVLAQPWLDWIYRALVLLVIACPCALVISTPVTVVSGLAAAARRGIVVKGGLYLEQGHLLRTIALDKTGTLTHGKPTLTEVVPIDGYPEAETLRIAGSLEALSEHPVAIAITAALRDQPHAAVTGFEALPGRGARGVIDRIPYWIGNHRLAEELRVCSPALEAVLDRLEAEAKTAVVLATGDRVLAVLAVADSLRPASEHVIGDLKSMGIAPVMLTGDNEKTARAIATRLGIDDVRSELLPEEKLAVVESLRSAGPVGMVGDGVNDAPALARADIGFVMGGAGTDVAIETADVALMQDDLHKLPEFIRLSRTTSRILWQNIAIALGIKAAVFAATLAGHGTLWLAVFADMGASLIVVFNGLRLLGSAGRETPAISHTPRAAIPAE
jgi:Cd2+/Zn2+-exporting ATPase